MKTVVIGAGLAGCEAAYYLARRGVEVELVEMKPKKMTAAHESENFCELVCSNSLKSDDTFGTASGLLKAELKKLGSLTMEAAEKTRVPAAVRSRWTGSAFLPTLRKKSSANRAFILRRGSRRSFP